MPGCLPLFFLMAALVVALIMLAVRVSLPATPPPRGVGNVYYRNDELTRFRVRQHSALPMRFPDSIDPVAQLPIPEHNLPLPRKMPLQPAPPAYLPDNIPDSIVLDPELLLKLPPPANEQQDSPES